MASSNNLAMLELWMFRSNTVADSWYPDSFARETESALTKALQQSFFPNHPVVKQSDTASASNVTASGSASEPETPGSRRRLGVTIAKPVKRKSRASKRSMTTFIQADPSNFRQMVQQVTGVKLQDLPVVKPEFLRQPFINKLQGLLPTLDTSAYLLHHQNNNNNNTHRIPVSVNHLTEDGTGFYSFSSFPTLESSF
ncbi:putative VQ motif-containing protein [Helianthus annuus]|nr:putative VQ motif-containing protein [Helianthus annuus]